MALSPSSELPARVLFACNLNSIRSPMAEGIAKHYFGHRAFFDSTGVRTGDVNGFAVAALDEIGIDISNHTPKSFGDLEDAEYDLVISLTPEAQHQAVELTRTMSCDLEYWPTADPADVSGSRDTIMEAFRSIRDTLEERIKERFTIDKAPQV